MRFFLVIPGTCVPLQSGALFNPPDFICQVELITLVVLKEKVVKEIFHRE